MATATATTSSLGNISWKGITFTQIISTPKLNQNTNTSLQNLFRALPLKIYRETVSAIPPTNVRSSSSIRKVMETPNGVVKGGCTSSNAVLTYLTDTPSSLYASGDCPTTSGVMCDSATKNALRRIRSAGQIRARSSNIYSVNAEQYLDNRDRTFAQNQFNYPVAGTDTSLIAGSPQALKANVRFVQNCSGQFNVESPIVIYKPSNWKFATQGAVSSGARLDRLKYDSIQKSAIGQSGQSYGKAVTYGGSYGPYSGTTFTVKNDLGYPEPSLQIRACNPSAPCYVQHGEALFENFENFAVGADYQYQPSWNGWTWFCATGSGGGIGNKSGTAFFPISLRAISGDYFAFIQSISNTPAIMTKPINVPFGATATIRFNYAFNANDFLIAQYVKVSYGGTVIFYTTTFGVNGDWLPASAQFVGLGPNIGLTFETLAPTDETYPSDTSILIDDISVVY